jgi:hypothetical protein
MARERATAQPIMLVEDWRSIRSGHGFEDKGETNMKRQALKMFALLTLLVMVGATAVYGQVTARYDIPFNFVVAGKLLPAGEYLVQRGSPNDQSLLVMHNMNRRISLATGTILIGGRDLQNKSKLVFRRYGEEYFLAQVWIENESIGRKIKVSRSERQVALKQEPASAAMNPETVVVFARTSQGGASEAGSGQ